MLQRNVKTRDSGSDEQQWQDEPERLGGNDGGGSKIRVLCLKQSRDLKLDSNNIQI